MFDVLVRINAVSKGHQSQMFKVQVSYNTYNYIVLFYLKSLFIQISEDTGDPNKLSYITPVCSVPVEVRSKRNNLKRRFNEFQYSENSNKYFAEGFVNFTGNVNSNQGAQMHFGYPQYPQGPAVNHSNSYPPHSIAPPSVHAASSVHHQQPSPAPVPKVYPEVAKVVQPATPVVAVNPVKPSEPTASLVSPLAMDSAVGNVLRWAGAVMSGLQEMQWRHIGYERFPDGCLDTSRPLYAMTNPNSTIADIIQLYSNETMASLQFLVKEADSYRQQAIKDAMVIFAPDQESESLASTQSNDRGVQPVTSTALARPESKVRLKLIMIFH